MNRNKVKVGAAGKWEQYTDLKIKYVNDGFEAKSRRAEGVDGGRPPPRQGWRPIQTTGVVCTAGALL